jgi:hypothetical protein
MAVHSRRGAEEVVELAINSSAKRVPVRLLDNGVAIIGEMGGSKKEYILAAEALRSVLTGTPVAR